MILDMSFEPRPICIEKVVHQKLTVARLDKEFTTLLNP
jgi:hypothetical protein